MLLISLEYLEHLAKLGKGDICPAVWPFKRAQGFWLLSSSNSYFKLLLEPCTGTSEELAQGDYSQPSLFTQSSAFPWVCRWVPSHLAQRPSKSLHSPEGTQNHWLHVSNISALIVSYIDYWLNSFCKAHMQHSCHILHYAWTSVLGWLVFGTSLVLHHDLLQINVHLNPSQVFLFPHSAVNVLFHYTLQLFYINSLKYIMR